MKFGVLLRTSAADVPELEALYACYKVLKKRLKQLPERGRPGAPGPDAAPAPGHELGPDGAASAAEREAAFVETLIEDVATFNDLFMEREEEHVIRLRSLEDAAAAAHTAEQAQALKPSACHACACCWG